MPAREPSKERLNTSSELRPEGDARSNGLHAESRQAALSLIPHGTFVLTSAFGETRGGILARWVQQVSSNPPMIAVAIEKGQPLSPVIRDARRFALCQLSPEDRVLRRLFEAERHDTVDPFLGLPTTTSPGGSPILLKAMAWLDCELTRHLDVEGNCELYIGLVHVGGVIQVPSVPPVGLVAPGRDEPLSVPAADPRGTNGRLHGTSNGNGHGNSNGNGHASIHGGLPRLPKRRESR